jgi:hypothetical protein
VKSDKISNNLRVIRLTIQFKRKTWPLLIFCTIENHFQQAVYVGKRIYLSSRQKYKIKETSELTTQCIKAENTSRSTTESLKKLFTMRILSTSYKLWNFLISSDSS